MVWDGVGECRSAIVSRVAGKQARSCLWIMPPNALQEKTTGNILSASRGADLSQRWSRRGNTYIQRARYLER